MPTVYIGVGSNIDPEINIPAALLLLGEQVRIVSISTFYQTEPVGVSDSPPFYNGIVGVVTDIPPRELKFEILRNIEEVLGRIRGADKYAPRTIDLDIIVYGNAIINEPGLVIPDPDIVNRAFIAVPLLELEPDLVLPDYEVKLADVVESMPADSMVPLIDFTRRLRLEIMNEPRENTTTD